MTEAMRIILEGKLEYHCLLLNHGTEFKFKTGFSVIERNKIANGIIDKHLEEFPNYFPEFKILIAVTMYNEEPELFAKTMNAIHKNIEVMMTEGLSEDDVGVVVMVDGIKPFYDGIKKMKEKNDRHRNYYDSIFDIEAIYTFHEIGKRFKKDTGRELSNDQNFQELLNKKYKIERNYSAESLKISQMYGKQYYNRIIKENTKDRFWEISHSFHCKAKFSNNSKNYLNLYFCVKHENKKKLHSHLWFFGGFCKVINPEYCVLIDVGTEPQSNALFLLYRALEKDAQIAGACGEIVPIKEEDSVFDLLYYAQKVEYKFCHILDRALESMIGYITVLPGAFSIYRFQALQPNNIKGPLWKDYFKPLMKPWKMNCYNSNIYLAEDRVLCFCLFTAEGKRNLLKYVRKAVAYTDPPPTYDALISQRRRWLNGSFFGLFNTLLKSHKIFWTAHNPLRKIFFLLQMLYYLLNLIFSLIIVSFFLIAVNSCIHILFSNSNVQISSLLTFYIILLGIILILSLGSDVKNMKNFFQVISTFLSIYMFFVMVFLVQMIYDSLYSKDLILPIILTFFSFFIIIVLNKELCNVSIGIIQFLFVTPVFLNIFTIYSICNIHDVSWGNRTSEMNKREKVLILDFEKYRTYCLLFWLFINSVFLFFFGDADGKSANYFYYIGTVGMGLIYVRFVGGIAHLVKQKCCKYTFIERIRKPGEDFTDKNTISYIS